MNKSGQKFTKFFFGPVDTIRIDTFRMCLGFAVLYYMAFRWINAVEWLTPFGFHVSKENLPYHDFWVPLLTPELLPWFGFVFFGSMTAFIAGWQLRYSKWILLVCLVYVTAADQLSAFSPNKVLITALFILACAPLGSHWSISRDRITEQSAWPLRILQMTIIIHLFTAGTSKVFFGEWFNNPYVLWTQVQGTYRTEFAAILLNKLPMPCWAFMQISALLFELMAPVLLIHKPFRWIAFAWGGVFLLMIASTMQHLIFFMVIILAFFVLFVEERSLQEFKSMVSIFKRAP